MNKIKLIIAQKPKIITPKCLKSFKTAILQPLLHGVDFSRHII